MIDLHSHLLPGLDDGPEDIAGTLTMAEVAVANGIRTMVATPHIREDHPRVDPWRLPELAMALEAELAAHGIGLHVLAGGELALTRAVDMSDDELRAVTLAGNGTDLLLETPHEPLPSLFEPMVERLMERGFRVTLAHPELNPDFQRDIGRLAALVDRGALTQVTASSLEARWSRRGRFARKALKEGLVHVVASDAHSATWRPPDLGPALALGEIGRTLTQTAPAAILAGDPLPPA